MTRQIASPTLGLTRESLYDAQELAQIVPLFGREAYDELRRTNRWSDVYLPNAEGAPDESRMVDRLPLPSLKKVIEWGSGSIVGRWMEGLEAARNIRRFNRSNRFQGWTKATRERHSLRESMKQDIEDAWRRRLEALEAAEG